MISTVGGPRSPWRRHQPAFHQGFSDSVQQEMCERWAMMGNFLHRLDDKAGLSRQSIQFAWKV